MYSLFTDASYNYLESGHAVLAGVILDPENKPIVEFSVKTDEMSNHEGLAIAHGIELARQMGIKKLRCFTDSLTNAKSKPERYFAEVDWFETLTINYIPRRFNQYANALSRVLVNSQHREDGDIKKAYHGVNRAKGSFYRRLRSILENERQYTHNWEYKRASAKFNCIMKELELASNGIKKIDLSKMKHLVEQLYELFSQYHFEEVSSLDHVLNTKNIVFA